MEQCCNWIWLEREMTGQTKRQKDQREAMGNAASDGAKHFAYTYLLPQSCAEAWHLENRCRHHSESLVQETSNNLIRVYMRFSQLQQVKEESVQRLILNLFKLLMLVAFSFEWLLLVCRWAVTYFSCDKNVTRHVVLPEIQPGYDFARIHTNDKHFPLSATLIERNEHSLYTKLTSGSSFSSRSSTTLEPHK